MSNQLRERAIRHHREMWNWIAEEIKEGRINDITSFKSQYICMFFGCNSVDYDCFLCDYCNHDSECVAESEITFVHCGDGILCPLKWENTLCVKSEYKEISSLLITLMSDLNRDERTGLKHKAVELAMKIANLPENEKSIFADK